MRVARGFIAAVLVGYLLLAIGPGRVLALTRVCIPPEVDGLIATIPGQPDGIPQAHNGTLVSALYRMRGPHFGFRRGDYVGMDIPVDAQVEAKFWMLPGHQFIEFWGSPSQPKYVWIYWYPDHAVFTVYTPVSGAHFGKHPCNDLRVARAAAEAVYNLVQKGE